MRSSARGFLLVELVVSVAITVAVLASVFQLLNPAYGIFEMELEQADMQQRGRASVEAMVRDIHSAGAGAAAPAVAPYRRGLIAPDVPGSVFADRVSAAYVLPAVGATTVTYWARTDRDDVPQLMRYDGRSTDLPVSDFVSGLRFAYFDSGGLEIDIDRFRDGPWLPDAVSPDRYDADLLAIRRVRLVLQVRPSRTLLRPRLRDHDFSVDVALRNTGAR